jgi:sortase B
MVISPTRTRMHPVMWLLTPDGDYKIEVVAGYVTTVGTEIYTFDQSDDTVLDIVRRAVEQSTFKTDLTLKKGDRYITLSTCSYEYDDARYVLIGRLNELK